MLLLIDNYDSFTFNLVHYFAELGTAATVHRNDALSVMDALALKPDAIVLSPGPCTPNEAGICLPLIQAAADANIPLLGVCLGHQALGQAFGGQVTRAHKPMHGKTSLIRHQQHALFTHIPSPFQVARYHSLIVTRTSIPETLQEIATSDDDQLVMALAHRSKPLYGVQFHPESIASHYGHQLLENFLALAMHRPVRPIGNKVP